MLLSWDNIHPRVYSCKRLKATLNAAFLHNTEQGQIYTYTFTMHTNTSKHLIEKRRNNMYANMSGMEISFS